MKLGFTRRGQPLIVLILLLGGWVSARAMLFDPAELPEATPAGSVRDFSHGQHAECRSSAAA